MKDLIIKILNRFETGAIATDYTSIFLYKDGPHKTKQVTLGRGYTEAGTLWRVFEVYKSLNGKNGDQLLSYSNKAGKEILPNDKTFLQLLKDSCSEKAMRDAQDKVFDELYWDRGIKYFNAGGFKENLSLAVIQDTFLHSGSFLKFLTNSFPEKRPIDGGNEKIWIKSYLKARLNWLVNSGGLLANTKYRPLFFLKEIEKNNWVLKTPLVANGIKIS